MIRVEKLGKGFRALDPGQAEAEPRVQWVFRDLSFFIARGSSIAILGPSGSGKSVLLKTIAGLLKSDEGKVELGSSRLAMLFQRNALFDSFSVAENLLFPLHELRRRSGARAMKKSVDLERVKFLLNAVGLSGTESLFPDELSGGMQKRLGIARAWITEPEIILYDEPTAGLDPITSRLIAELIVRMKREKGTTLALVTNDVARARQIGDRIYLLANGSLIDGGTPHEIMRSEVPSIRQFVRGLQEGPL